MNVSIDGLGTQHFFKKVPCRIVSLVPSQTELLYDLGLEDSIVGITKFCVHPKHFKTTKKVVGGTKNIDFEKIKNLEPDIIICNQEENTEEIVAQLQTLCPVWVSKVETLSDSLAVIAELGKLFNVSLVAEHWINAIQLKSNELQQLIEKKIPLKVAYFIWANPFMVAGKHTFINDLLGRNNFENIYSMSRFENSRYPTVTLENIQSDGNPDLILLSSEPFPFKKKHANEISKFAPHSKILIVDGEMFSWHGTRLLKALTYFCELQVSIFKSIF